MTVSRRRDEGCHASHGTTVGGVLPLVGESLPIVSGLGADPETLLAIGLIGVFVAIHLYGGRIFLLDIAPRSWILSLSGGVSVAYVFVHVLPEIRAAEVALARETSALSSVEERIYLVALLGFVLYYGLEQFVQSSAEEVNAEEDVDGFDGTDNGADAEDSDTSAPVFWIHIGSFAAYNGLIGYLVFHREAPGVSSIALFGLAMGLHLFVNDYGLRDRHRDAYRRRGRWVLALGVVAGGLAGALTSVNRAVFGVAFAFLSGGIVLNVIKEELPPERASRFWAFAAGALAYALLLVHL